MNEEIVENEIELNEFVGVTSDTPDIAKPSVQDVAYNIYNFVVLLNFIIIVIFLYKYLKNTFSFRKGV